MCDNPSTGPVTLSCGLNVQPAFVSIENMTQKHIKIVLAESKSRSFKESDFE